ncbi:MAG: hypothetical protein P8171_23830 [Candidatus Thiodiazotropha sp.]
MMRLFSATSLVLLASLAAGPAQPAPPAMDMPAKGMSMEQVRQMYGDPVKTLPAVGEPPITRWVYSAYTVYFEYTHVIHSVPNN